MYPGQPAQPGPQAPHPHGGGFDPSFAPPQHAFVPGQGPGFVPVSPQYAPPQHYAGQPGQPAPAPQHYAQPIQPAAPQHYAQPIAPAQYAQPAPQNPAYAVPPPVLDAAYEARMRQAAMGNGRRNPLPIGDYVVVIESSEIALVGPPQGRQMRVFFAQIVVESSSNPAIPVGHKAKFSKFLESDYNMDQAMGEFKEMCASFYGATSESDLWARFPNWLRDVQTAPGPFRGVRLSGSVKQRLTKEKKLKFDDAGQPVTRETWQKIG